MVWLYNLRNQCNIQFDVPSLPGCNIEHLNRPVDNLVFLYLFALRAYNAMLDNIPMDQEYMDIVTGELFVVNLCY